MAKNGLYGIKDCGDLTLYNRKTGKPALHINYANSFEISFSSSPVYATKKGKKAIVWDGEIEGTCTISTQLTSNELFALVFGGELTTGAQKLYKREVFTLTSADEVVTIKGTPKGDTVNAFVIGADGATHEEELASASVSGKSVTLTGGAKGDKVAVYYLEDGVGGTFTVKGTKDSADYKLVCLAFGKDYATGEPTPMQITLPKVAPQTNATLTFSAENPSSFDIVLDILIDENDELLIIDDLVEGA